MRPIKFREWDKEEKKMFVVAQIDFENEFIGFVSDLPMISKELKNIDLMQFTGLTDKNGKEVWEGDILKCRFMIDYNVFREPELIEVTFESGRFRPMTDTKQTQYRMLPYYYDYEVVGNKYENPELLKII